MGNHKQRFKRWHAKLPNRTRYLADLILTEVVPLFEGQGFRWYEDYAGGDIQQVANHSIPLQRRAGDFWPTVEISFDKRKRSELRVNFAVLPPDCRRWTEDGWVAVSQSEAALVDGNAMFCMRGRSRLHPLGFGYRYFSPQPKRLLKKDVAFVVEQLPELFQLFDSGELNRKTELPDTASAFCLTSIMPGKYD